MNSQIYKSKNKAISFWIGINMVVALADGEQASIVLKTVFEKRNIHKFMKDYIGNGSVFAPVKFWQPRRKILVPTFSPRNVNQFVPVFEAQNKVTAELLESRVGKGNFSCYDVFSGYAFDSLCETLYGINMDMQRHPGHPVFNILTQCLKTISARLFQPWLFVDAIYKKLPLYAQQMRMIKETNEFFDDLIYKMKARIEEADVEDTKPRLKTFLELILGNSREAGKGTGALTHEEVREEMIVLAVGGTDTTAVAISFTILLLANHQDVQDKVCTEIQDVLGNSDKPLQVEDLLKLKYTRAVIKESLRLYPPVPIITRNCEKDVELPTGLVLPKGTNVAINIWGIHRNPEHWGEDANEFNPDRFMKGEIPNNAFMAFSSGPRNCVGQRYAMLSMTSTLVTMLRRYRFTPATNFKYDKNNPFRLSYEIMLKNADNFSSQVEYR